MTTTRKSRRTEKPKRGEWAPLPTWKGNRATYTDTEDCPRCGSSIVFYEGPSFHRRDNGTLWKCVCLRCGLNWTLKEYPNPAYEAMSDEERANRHYTPSREVIF